MLKNKIQLLAKKYHAQSVAVRRHLHAHPELSFKEVETGKFIADQLSALQIPHTTGWADNGVVAIIEGKNPSNKTIALRADFDALPITEANEVPYVSLNKGVMHACGHDAHTASLLGAAKILYELRDEWEGTLKLIFQPAEERIPGGASLMIGEGVLKNPAPTAIVGQHVLPSLMVGKVGFRSGLYMASADEIYLTVKGEGGHGAMPQLSTDVVLMASHIVVALQHIVSRCADPTIPTVLSFGKINSTGGATNVLPNEVKLEGTFRTMNEKWRLEASELLKKTAQLTAESMGGTCEVEVRMGYPFLINDALVTAESRRLAEEYLGAENVVELPMRMTAEDFAYYAQVVPACFYRLGTAATDGTKSSELHTDTFDIDESSLQIGAGLMAWLAVGLLSKN